jgi:hypothetical protein
VLSQLQDATLQSTVETTFTLHEPPLAMTVCPWKVFPSRTRHQDPQNTVEDIACWHRPATGIADSVIFSEQSSGHLPLFFGQFHHDLRP